MAIIILRRQGISDMEPIARWDDGEWTDGEEQFGDDPAYQHYDEDMMMAEFDGPDLFAITEEDWQGRDA